MNEWMYRFLLQLYPPEFRDVFGREMLLVHRDQQRDGVVSAWYWCSVIADVLVTTPRLWFEELRDGLLSTKTNVRIVAGLAVLIGLLEAANSLLETNAMTWSSRDPLSQTMLVLVLAASLLLTVAGLALLFRGKHARLLGTAGAIACLGAFVSMASTRQLMSGVSTLAGVAFPTAMLVFLHLNRDRLSRAIV